jgi:hypothetical protein
MKRDLCIVLAYLNRKLKDRKELGIVGIDDILRILEIEITDINRKDIKRTMDTYILKYDDIIEGWEVGEIIQNIDKRIGYLCPHCLGQGVIRNNKTILKPEIERGYIKKSKKMKRIKEMDKKERELEEYMDETLRRKRKYT